jgi:hypothetical protein
MKVLFQATVNTVRQKDVGDHGNLPVVTPG